MKSMKVFTWALLVAVASMFLSSCASTAKRGTQAEVSSGSRVYDRNTGTIIMIDTNAVKGDPVRHITPTTQETIISTTTPFVVHYDSVPPGGYVAVRQVDPKSLAVVVQVRQLLAEHCESIVVYDRNILPMVINRAKSGCFEQVVVTPVFDQDCNMKGYQLRYGSRESGCTDAETETYMQNYKRCQCTGEGQQPPIRKSGPPPAQQVSKQMHILYVNPVRGIDVDNARGF